jgi:hypothetical protein
MELLEKFEKNGADAAGQVGVDNYNITQEQINA